MPRVVSLQNEFTQFWQAAKNQPFNDQIKLWDQFIESPHQEFFDFAVWEKQFRSNWPEAKAQNLEFRFAHYARLYGPIENAFDSFPSVVKTQIKRFKKIIPEFEPNFPIYAIVAPNFDAKSAIISANPRSVALVIALDSVALEKADYEVLFPHELFHAFHALHSGFFNDGVMAGTSILVPLWEEGLATYISGLANPGISDDNLLFDTAFEKLNARDIRWLAQQFVKQSDLQTLDPAPTAAFKMWFSNGKFTVREDLPRRCGYFLGLHVVREVAKTHSLKEMINWGPKAIPEHVVIALNDLSK